jgi:hypothetical protein
VVPAVLWVTMDHLVIVVQLDHVGHEANAVILVHWVWWVLKEWIQAPIRSRIFVWHYLVRRWKRSNFHSHVRDHLVFVVSLAVQVRLEKTVSLGHPVPKVHEENKVSPVLLVFKVVKVERVPWDHLVQRVMLVSLFAVSLVWWVTQDHVDHPAMEEMVETVNEENQVHAVELEIPDHKDPLGHLAIVIQQNVIQSSLKTSRDRMQPMRPKTQLYQLKPTIILIMLMWMKATNHMPIILALSQHSTYAAVVIERTAVEIARDTRRTVCGGREW